ncbi:MAG: transporter permease, partial [Phenylobacterium sp.]|nr:transporter permease [Phenylobacterium sp.]
DGAGAHAAALRIAVAAGVRLTLLESYRGEGSYLARTTLDLAIGEGARVERIVLAAEPAEAVCVSQAQVALSPHAEFVQTTLTGGARRQRLETRVVHPGGHAKLRLDGVYLLAGKRHADLTTAVTHEAVDGTTDQLTKGVVRDQARGVFQGRIVVAEGADRTEARMGHHALLLSDQAEVDAKPELEIYADDVACGHGNTVGALDEEALFYMRQRGIPEPQARSLLTEAFIGEVIDRISHDGAREVARAWAAERLKG